MGEAVKGFCEECGRPIRLLFDRWFHLEARDTRFCSAVVVKPRAPKIEDAGTLPGD